METLLLLLMLNAGPNQEAIDSQLEKKRMEEQEKGALPMPSPPIRICTKTDKGEDCRHLTQSELSGGAVRGNKIVDEEQP